MEDWTFTSLLYDEDALLMEAIETHVTNASPFNSTQGATTSESEDDPMCMEEEAPKKKNKPTYYARKDEIQTLQAELGALTERLEEIQDTKQQDNGLDDAVLENALLRGGLKQTDLTLAGAQSIMANYRATHGRNPLDVQINLSADPTRRHQTLTALRDERLAEATDFILERVRYLDLRRPHRESESFELPNGDHVLLQCEVEPCRTNASVKLVFDDIIMAIIQQEFTVWESLGVTTTFESDESQDFTYAQTRGISTMPDGAQFEKNIASFRMYSDGSKQLNAPHGLVALHPVAQDERYPFQPQNRVRQDTTMVLMTCPLPGGGGVVTIRWAYVLTHKPQCAITRLQEMRMRDISARWNEIVRNNALEFVLGRMEQQA
ncbi:hypothetical protein Poli38472_012357 [Pythium oligandrum]|uniref:Uncharacterized protein n=1 Tax=Pythium oligandrum TaxID=41045 RepID=A0A8K1CRA9_PYTOL|nr:hypothetical protein Poli38472_012357 [Pythium oligandrum]|eukprot:TMW67241.1 hypothetical protein Poli38472_012357 [Pythium oligandrum]